eukprot:8214938-Pyramimonas_sp.AAC.1
MEMRMVDQNTNSTTPPTAPRAVAYTCTSGVGCLNAIRYGPRWAMAQHGGPSVGWSRLFFGREGSDKRYRMDALGVYSMQATSPPAPLGATEGAGGLVAGRRRRRRRKRRRRRRRR